MSDIDRQIKEELEKAREHTGSFVPGAISTRSTVTAVSLIRE